MPAAPLSQTLAGSPVPAGLRLLAGLPDDRTDWTTATALLAPTALDALVSRVHERVLRLVPPVRRGAVPPSVAPSYVLEWYLWAVCSAAATPFVHARRVPSLAPDDVALQLGAGGWPVAVALLSPRFACLPDDPHARHPDARPADDLPALRAVLRSEVAGHAEALVAAWGRRGGRGRHALWAVATDALLDAVQAAAGGGRGAREAAAVLPDRPGQRPDPFVRAAPWTGVGRPGAPDEPFRRRVSCCLAYTVPDAEACFGCPRTDDAERARRLAAAG